MRVPSVEDVFALGDCAGFLEQTGKPVLPALAQVSLTVYNVLSTHISDQDNI
jgi:NADH dehydrogenase FAD-containing subunit